MISYKEFLILESEQQLDYSGFDNDMLSDRISDLVIQYDDVQFRTTDGVIHNESIFDVTNDDENLYFQGSNETYTVDKNYDIIIGPKRVKIN